MSDITEEEIARAVPWPIGWDGKPKPFTKLTHAERRRLMAAKRVSIPAAAIRKG